MKNKMRSSVVRQFINGFMVFGVLLSLAAVRPAQADELDGRTWTIDRELEIAKGGSFLFAVPVGTVEIKNHAGDQVLYSGEFKAKNTREAKRLFPLLEEKSFTDGDRTEIVFQWKNGKSPRRSSVYGKHVIQLPAAANIEITTAGGKIEVADRSGAVKVKTSGGSIRMGDVRGELVARTSGGSISMGSGGADATLNTSGGKIRVVDVAGSLSARTSGGSISVGSVTGHLDANTSGGSISAVLKNQVSKPVNLKTSGGSIQLVVPSNFKATLDARTSGGRVVCELPLKVAGKFSKRSIEGAVNGGGPKVTLRTSGGSIVLKKG